MSTLTHQVAVLVLYHSRHGTTRKLARQIARGVESIEGCQALLRQVPEIEPRDSANSEQSGDPLVTLEELKQADGIAVGSPVWFGNMSGAMKHFWDQTSGLWVRGDLIDKPACVFTSSSSPHGGQETTLQSMMLPLLHHGMLVVGIPYSEPNLHQSQLGGTPYGASSVSTETHTLPTQVAELAYAQGARLANIARKLSDKS